MELERKLSSSLVDDIISNSLLEFKPQSTEVCYEVILSTDMGHKLDDKCDYSEPKFTNGDDIIKDGNILRSLSESFMSDVISQGLVSTNVVPAQAKGAGVEDICERTEDTDCTESLPADTVGGVIMDVSSEGGCAEVGASQDVLEYHLNECVDGPLEIAHIADIVQLPIGEDDNKTDQLATDTEIFLSHNDPLVQSSHNSVVDMSLYVLQSDYHSLEEMLAHENEKTNRLTVELNSLQNELNMLRRNHLKGCEEMSNQISDSNQRNVMKDVEIASLNATVATLMAQMAESQRLWEAERNKMECERQATDALMLEINEQNKAFQISSNEKNALNSALLKEVVSAEEKLKCTIEKYEVS